MCIVTSQLWVSGGLKSIKGAQQEGIGLASTWILGKTYLSYALVVGQHEQGFYHSSAVLV